jgi:hypothetical protein
LDLCIRGSKQVTFMNQQFWVIGGEYRCLEFRELANASAPIGPFASYEEAEQVWRTQAEQTRGDATTRYTIVTTAPNPRRMAA